MTFDPNKFSPYKNPYYTKSWNRDSFGKQGPQSLWGSIKNVYTSAPSQLAKGLSEDWAKSKRSFIRNLNHAAATSRYGAWGPLATLTGGAALGGIGLAGVIGTLFGGMFRGKRIPKVK